MITLQLRLNCIVELYKYRRGGDPLFNEFNESREPGKLCQTFPFYLKDKVKQN